METQSASPGASLCAIFHGPALPFSIEEVPLPELQEGELLVRNEFTTLCRSDVNTFCGRRTEKTPTILGHEIVGRIAALGPGAPEVDSRGSPLEEGDRITWAIYAADPSGALARAGIPQKAPDLFKYGHEAVTANSHLHGGLAEYCILRRHTPVVRLLPELPLPVAALINCSAATVAGALRLAGDVSSKRVLITGAGMLGLFGCAMCRKGGADAVVAADISTVRLEKALEFGATESTEITEGVWKETDTPEADIHLDFSGDPATVEQAIGRLAVGGCSVFVGATYPQRSLSLNAETIVRGLLTIRGLHNYNEGDLVTAVAFIETEHTRFPFCDLVDDRFTLLDVNLAFAHAKSSNAYRVGLHTS